jgi:hypothetical protein
MGKLGTAIASFRAVLADPRASASQKAAARRVLATADDTSTPTAGAASPRELALARELQAARAAGKDGGDTVAPEEEPRRVAKPGKRAADEDAPSLDEVIELLRQVEDDDEASDEEKKNARKALRELGEQVVDDDDAKTIARAMGTGDPFKAFVSRQRRAIRGGR